MKKIPLNILNKQNGTNLLNEYEFCLHMEPWATLLMDSEARRLNKRVKRISPKYFFGHDITPETITTNMSPQEQLAHFFDVENK